jgi:hypothetical protein
VKKTAVESELLRTRVVVIIKTNNEKFAESKQNFKR